MVQRQLLPRRHSWCSRWGRLWQSVRRRWKLECSLEQSTTLEENYEQLKRTLGKKRVFERKNGTRGLQRYLSGNDSQHG